METMTVEEYKKLQSRPMGQSAGAAFEDEIILIAKQTKGLFLVHQYPEVTFFEKGRATVTGVAYPDFIGSIHGMSFMFDAKSTNNKSAISMPADRKHQFFHLREAAQDYVYAFYLVEWRRYYRVELFRVDENSTWPFRCKFDTGYSVSKNDNWLYKLLLRTI